MKKKLILSLIITIFLITVIAVPVFATDALVIADDLIDEDGLILERSIVIGYPYASPYYEIYEVTNLTTVKTNLLAEYNDKYTTTLEISDLNMYIVTSVMFREYSNWEDGFSRLHEFVIATDIPLSVGNYTAFNSSISTYGISLDDPNINFVFCDNVGFTGYDQSVLPIYTNNISPIHAWSEVRMINSAYTYQFEVVDIYNEEINDTEEILKVEYYNYDSDGYSKSHKVEIYNSSNDLIMTTDATVDAESILTVDLGLPYSDTFTFKLFEIDIIDGVTYWDLVDTMSAYIEVIPALEIILTGDTHITIPDEGYLNIDSNVGLTDITLFVYNHSADELVYQLVIPNVSNYYMSYNLLPLYSFTRYEVYNGKFGLPDGTMNIQYPEPNIPPAFEVVEFYTFEDYSIGTAWFNLENGDIYDYTPFCSVYNKMVVPVYFFVNDVFIGNVTPYEYVRIFSKDEYNTVVGSNSYKLTTDIEGLDIYKEITITILKETDPLTPPDSGGSYNPDYDVWEFPNFPTDGDILDYIKYPFEFIGALFKNLFGFINTLINGVGELSNMLADLFSFIPPVFFNLMFGVILISVIFGILKFIRGN